MNPFSEFLVRLVFLSVSAGVGILPTQVRLDPWGWFGCLGIVAIFTGAAVGGLRGRHIVGWVAFEHGRIVTSEPPVQGGPFGGDYVHARLVRQPGVLGVVVLCDPFADAKLLLPLSIYDALRHSGMPDVSRRS